MRVLRLLVLLFSILTFAAPSQAQLRDTQRFIEHPVRVCAAEPGSDLPPDFGGAQCRSMPFFQIDPQDRMLWVELIFVAEPALLESDKPLGLFISAKASSQAALNGVALGSNGTPGVSALSEVPGDMDAVFFVQEGTLKPGENRLIMRFSSMNGGVTLNSPIHNITLAPYRDPRQPGPATWFALVTFGLFIAGFVFFGVSALRGKDRKGAALIAAISLMAALQLAAETARDILPYPYPLHDLRLTLILAFGIGLGLSLVAYLLFRLFGPYPKWRILALAGLLAVMMLISALQPGFDTKTIGVFIAAALAAGLSGAVGYLQGSKRAGWLALSGLALAGVIYGLGGFFLDTVIYLMIAVSLLWLFFKHARGGNEGEGEGAGAGAGESVGGTGAAGRNAPKRIELTSNGKVEFVDSRDVVCFSGAGDYVEVFLTSGRSVLYSASLAALERDLSDGFIRVHRSHIVNAEHVKSLKRESAGTGELLMSDGSRVPVSRRNMASVRGALKHD